MHLGGTRDDAAGEAYDKVAKMMGLGYPGGRIIDNLAQGGNPKAVRFPRAQIKKGSYQFSFSGIKTSVWHYLKAQDKEEWQNHLADIAASFQEAVVDMLVKPTVKAAIAYWREWHRACRRRRREQPFAREDDGKRGFGRAKSLFPSPKFCTDNGAMIALAGHYALKRGRRDDFRLNADADLTL